MTRYKNSYYKKSNHLFRITWILAFLVAGLSPKLVAQDTTASKKVSVQGFVTDRNGKPLDGVLVNISEQNKITKTDTSGRFSIDAMAEETLVFSLPGFKNVSLDIVPGKPMEITMVPGRDDLDDVVDMPYRSVLRKESLASVSSTKGDELQRYPVTSLENTFGGVLTGITTHEQMSEPGWDFPRVFLRGIRTVGRVWGGNEFEGWNDQRNNKPIVIVDNIERDITCLDAYAIDNITVLKDNASTAIYGMKGANGVIFVTTKRGIPGKTTIKFSAETGFQQLLKPLKFENSADYAYSVNRALILDNLTPKYTDEDIQKFRDGSDPYGHPNVDYQKEVLREFAPEYRGNFSISGGNTRTHYFVSMSYLRQEGIYNTKWTKENNSQHKVAQYNLRSNVDIDLTKTLNVSLDLGGRLTDIKQPNIYNGTLFTWITETPPTTVFMNPNGTFGAKNGVWQQNAAAWIQNSGYDQNYKRNLYSDLRLKQKLDFITKGLSVNGLVGFDAINVFQYGLIGEPAEYQYNADGTYTQVHTAVPLADWLGWGGTGARELRYNVNINYDLDYTRTFGDHSISAMYLYRQATSTTPGYTSPYRHQSYIGQLNYAFKGRYLLQAIGTYMGTDNFKPGENFGFFPGISGGWVASEEPFLKSVKAIELIKFRVSWGRAGNDLINPTDNTGSDMIRYPYQTIFAEGNGYTFGKTYSSQQGAYEQKAGNLRAKWEISDMTNLGLDLSFFQGKIYATIDAFYEWRTHILVDRTTVPLLYGLTAPKDAVGIVENKGFEVVLGHRNKLGDFGYFIEGNISFARNKIVSMDEVVQPYPWMQATGHPVDQPFGYIYDGFFQSQDQIDQSPKQTFTSPLKPGDIKWKDLNDDGVIDAKDRKAIGYNYMPEIVSGLNLGLSLKGFDVRALFVGEFHRSVTARLNAVQALFWNAKTTNQTKDSWGYYSDNPDDNKNAKWPRLSTVFRDNNYIAGNNFWLMNGEFIRLRNVEFGYSIPSKLVRKFGVSQFRFYVSGYNLYTWSPFKIADPESPDQVAWGYPKTRNYNVGFNLTF